MNRIITSLVFLLIFFPSSFCQVPSRMLRIEFRVTSPTLPDDSAVYICGNIPQLANWNPRGLKMNPSGNHTWTITVNTDASFPVEYKYTRGSWEKENTSPDGNPLPNFRIKVKGDTIIYDKVPGWLNRSERKITGKLTGDVKYIRQLKGEGLKDRDIIIWLPPGYNNNQTERYPVLYMEDGQNVFDPATSSFGNDWSIDETCDSLIRAKIISPLIVVGIYNTPDRMKEYTPGEAGTNYMKFVTGVVKPLVDKTFRTRSDRMNTYTGGSSAGGTISFMLAWNYPDIFSKAFCLSPAFRIQNIDLVKDVKDYKGKTKEIILYIDNGGKGLEERLQPGVDEMLSELQKKGYVLNRTLFYISAPDAEHNEQAWAKRMPAALKMLMGK